MKKYFYYYELGDYESRLFDSYEEAENAADEIEAEIASLCGFCDWDFLFIEETDDE